MKYKKTYHLEISLGVQHDDRILKDTSKLIGQNIVITEKLDGSNCCITKSGVYGRSHNEVTKNPWTKEIWDVYNKINDYLYDGLYIYGENMEAIHSIKYDKLDSYLYVFSILEANEFYSWDDLLDICDILNLKTVPVLYEGKINSIDELYKLCSFLMTNTSKFGNTLEGLVIRNRNSFNAEDFMYNVTKVVRANHIQTNPDWKKNWDRHLVMS